MSVCRRSPPCGRARRGGEGQCADRRRRGIRYSGDIAKVIAAGASSGDAGQLVRRYRRVARRDRAVPGPVVQELPGMGSLGAMQQGSSDRYFQELEAEDPIAAAEKLVPEGIEGRVPYKGALVNVIHQLMADCARRWDTPGRARSRTCARAPSSSRSLRRHPRIACARRADREGSAELPRGIERRGWDRGSRGQPREVLHDRASPTSATALASRERPLDPRSSILDPPVMAAPSHDRIDPRLRLAGHAANRPAPARDARLLRDPSLRRR